MADRILYTGCFSALERRLTEDLFSLCEEMAGERITVLVGSNLLALYLRRNLARQKPLFNVHFLTLKDLAMEMAGGVMGTNMLSGFARSLLAMGLSRKEGLQYFRDIASLPGFSAALASQWLELSEGGFSAWPDIRPGPENYHKMKELGTLYNDYCRLKGDLVDEGDLFRKAAQSPKVFHPLLVYGFYDLNYSQRLLLSRAFEKGQTRYYLPVARGWGETFAEDTCRWLTELGFRRKQLPEVAFNHKITAFSAAGDVQEAREITREILRLAVEENVRYQNMAVLARDEQPLRLVYSLLEAAQIPCYFPGGVKLAYTPEGSAVLLFLELLQEDPTRELVMTLIKYAPLDFTSLSCEPDLSLWEYLTLKAGYLHRQEDWHHWLLVLKPQSIENEDDEQGYRVPPEQVENFKQYITTLLDYRRTIAASNSWREFCLSLEKGIDSLLLASATLEQIKTLCRELAEWDGLASGINLQDYCRLLAEQVETVTENIGSYEQGVNLLPVMRARGLTFDAVFLMQVREKVFPAADTVDPLLQTEDRKLLNLTGSGKLDLKNRRYQEEQMLFALACRAARKELYLSYPRIDLATGGPLLPSHFMGEFVNSPVERRPELPGDLHRAVDRRELIRCLWRLSPRALRRQLDGIAIPGFHSANARMGTKFSEYDGIVGPVSRVKSQVSSSQLETYLDCPFRFMVARLLKVKNFPEPEAIETIQPMERGILVHKILEKVYRLCRQQDLLPLDGRSLAKALELLRQTCSEEFLQFETAGMTGYPLLWRMEQERIYARLEECLQAEADAGEGWEPAVFEAFFSGDKVGLPAGNVGFNGKIDRLDKKGSSVRVIDYKTGTASGEKEIPSSVKKGKDLQLVVYLLAATKMFHAEITGSRAEFLYLFDHMKTRRLEGDAWQDTLDSLEKLADLFLSGYSQGVFVPNYASPRCRSCDYSLVCGSSIYNRRCYQQKQGNSFIDGYRRFLREGC